MSAWWKLSLREMFQPGCGHSQDQDVWLKMGRSLLLSVSWDWLTVLDGHCPEHVAAGEEEEDNTCTGREGAVVQSAGWRVWIEL